MWKVPDSGGPEIQVTTTGGENPMETSDGKYLYYASKNRGANLTSGACHSRMAARSSCFDRKSISRASQWENGTYIL
jgi:hypothetical protein